MVTRGKSTAGQEPDSTPKDETYHQAAHKASPARARWRVSTDLGLKTAHGDSYVVIVTSDGHAFDFIAARSVGDEVHYANAHRLVLAFNAHDDLLAALKYEQAIEDDFRARGSMSAVEHDDRRAVARKMKLAAIAKAEGR